MSEKIKFRYNKRRKVELFKKCRKVKEMHHKVPKLSYTGPQENENCKEEKTNR
jgi:hypothetical protein